MQRVRDDLHPITHHSVNIHLLVLLCNSGQEENQPPLWLEHRSRKKNQIRNEFGKLIWLRRWNIRLLTPVEKVVRVRYNKVHRRAETPDPCAAINVWTRSVTVSRFFFLPSRFAPARIPSIGAVIRERSGHRTLSHTRWVRYNGIEQAAASPRVLGDVHSKQVDDSRNHTVLIGGSDDTRAGVLVHMGSFRMLIQSIMPRNVPLPRICLPSMSDPIKREPK